VVAQRQPAQALEAAVTRCQDGDSAVCTKAAGEGMGTASLLLSLSAQLAPSPRTMTKV